jgi:hypothetical protein
MKLGDAVLTKSIEARTSFDPRAMRATFKSNPGSMMLFLALGSLKADTPAETIVDDRLKLLGWLPVFADKITEVSKVGCDEVLVKFQTAEDATQFRDELRAAKAMWENPDEPR